jgi:hypothetical protein
MPAKRGFEQLQSAAVIAGKTLGEEGYHQAEVRLGSLSCDWRCEYCRYMVGDDEEDTSLLRELGERARSYLSDFSWCVSILEMYYGWGSVESPGFSYVESFPAKLG